MTDDDNAWDDSCWDPHRQAVDQGRAEGRETGLQAGYDEGWRLGQTTALEYGMELGYVSGVLQGLQAQGLITNTTNDNNPTKAQKTMQDLQLALEQFPNAQAMFAAVPPRSDSIIPTDAVADDTNDSEEQSHQQQQPDIRQQLQKIRARFRLLMVQLHLSPNLASLQQVMMSTTTNDKKESSLSLSGAANVVAPTTTEW